MLTMKEVEELERKVDFCDGDNLCLSHHRNLDDLLESLAAALKVVETAKKIEHIQHDGCDECRPNSYCCASAMVLHVDLFELLKPFDEKREE